MQIIIWNSIILLCLIIAMIIAENTLIRIFKKSNNFDEDFYKIGRNFRILGIIVLVLIDVKEASEIKIIFLLIINTMLATLTQVHIPSIKKHYKDIQIKYKNSPDLNSILLDEKEKDNG